MTCVKHLIPSTEQHILQPDELYLIKVMLNVELSVKCGHYRSNFFQTDTGAPQGDCASANEFTFYLAKSLEINENLIENNLVERKPSILEEHNYSKPNHIKHININQEYADDISEITSNPARIEYIKSTLPSKLQERNLKINISKTEEYKISRKNCDNTWKSCKLLGSLLDTDSDIKRRKGLTIDALQKLNYIFNNNKLSINTKMKAFNTYISSIFLYNSEIWTLNLKRENCINSFHRRILRTYIINVKWPTIIKIEDVYILTKTKPWTDLIKIRRMRWFGHVMRLSENTPVRKSLDYAREKYNRPQGRPITTWISMMTNQLTNDHQLTWEEACIKAENRNDWKEIMK